MANEVFAGSLQTANISTGNVATVNDPFIASTPIGQGGFGLVNGARNPLGTAVYVSDGTTSGRRWKVRYVRINPTTPPAAYIVGPVYWKDNTFQVVTTNTAEAPAGINGVAGFLLNAQATPSVLTGNYVFILVFGFIGAANLGSPTVPASTAAGDLLIGSAGNTQAMARSAAGANRTNVEVAYAMTAISGGLADVMVDLES